jgi:hypothetical protein
VATEVLLDERGSGAAGLVSLERRLDHLRSLAGDPAHRDALLRLYVRGQALRALLLRAGRRPRPRRRPSWRAPSWSSTSSSCSPRGAAPDALLAGPATDRFLYAPGCASPAAPARSSATSSPSACSACRASRASADRA